MKKINFPFHVFMAVALTACVSIDANEQTASNKTMKTSPEADCSTSPNGKNFMWGGNYQSGFNVYNVDVRHVIFNNSRDLKVSLFSENKSDILEMFCVSNEMASLVLDYWDAARASQTSRLFIIPGGTEDDDNSVNFIVESPKR